MFSLSYSKTRFLLQFFICKLGRIHAQCSHTKLLCLPIPISCAGTALLKLGTFRGVLSSASSSGATCVLAAHCVYPGDNGKEELCILVAHVGPHFAHGNNLISVFLHFSSFFWVLFLMLAPLSPVVHILLMHPASPLLHPVRLTHDLHGHFPTLILLFSLHSIQHW